MRSISATLKAAQEAGAINALVKLELTKGESSYTYAKPRVISIKETEDGSLQTFEITLNNSDGELTELDFIGYKGVLSFGAVTKAGIEYSTTAPMWMVPQRFDSAPDKLTCKLTLIGICNLMADDEASEAYMPDEEDTKSVKTLVNEIAGATLTCFSHCKAYEVVWEEGYDNLADTYKPKDAFRIYVGNNRNSAIDRLLEYTLNVKVVKADGKIHIFKPKTTGTDYDSEYSLKNGHPFFSKALRNRLVTPNYVKVQSREDDDPQYSGTAQDDSYATLPDELKKHHYKRTYLESNAQATAIAEAILARAQMWCEAGAADVPLNVGQEAFDYVKVTDQREGDYRVGNIGKLVRYYNLTKNEWRMTFTFGNWQNVRKALDQLGVTADDVENYFSRLQVGDMYVEHILADNMDFVWIDPDNTIDLSKIGDTLDNLPDGEVFARVKTLHLDAGIIKLDENILYSPGYNPTEKEGAIPKQDTAPENPSAGDLWCDTSSTPNVIKRWSGSVWLVTAAQDLDDLPDGSTYQRVKSASLTAEGLVLLDQVTTGTYGLVKSTDISAGHIKLDMVIEGTYGRVKSTDISAGHIKLSYCEGDLDDIDEGSTYGKLKQTDIDAGHIKLSSYTQVSGEWYDHAGVEIDANYGINIYGQNNALTTRATKTGTIQCSVNSSGQIVAGAGDVILDASGITIKSEKLKFYYSTTYHGYLKATSTGLVLYSLVGDIDVVTPTDKGIVAGGCDFFVLPQKSSAPTSPLPGMQVFNPSTGYTNVYHSGAWHHFNRDAGWA